MIFCQFFSATSPMPPRSKNPSANFCFLRSPRFKFFVPVRPHEHCGMRASKSVLLQQRYATLTPHSPRRLAETIGKHATMRGSPSNLSFRISILRVIRVAIVHHFLPPTVPTHF